NVGSVTSMGTMFRSTAFNRDIGGWDVGNVTSMANMFEQNAVFNQDISRWNVGKVTDMRSMFLGNAVFDQDISRWNVSRVANLGGFLQNGALSTEHYNALLIRWSRRSLQSGVAFHGGASKCDLGLPDEGRAYIRGNFGWTITDGGTTGQWYAGEPTGIVVR
ncbi:MAG: BspA family leucine-rich repeat surface protein, partial [Kiritimatiellae bacterium]|nr:BspA family leucine-rich repeat surface protein [Kiritimatiellia bacterium]